MSARTTVQYKQTHTQQNTGKAHHTTTNSIYTYTASRAHQNPSSSPKCKLACCTTAKKLRNNVQWCLHRKVERNLDKLPPDAQDNQKPGSIRERSEVIYLSPNPARCGKLMLCVPIMCMLGPCYYALYEHVFNKREVREENEYGYGRRGGGWVRRNSVQLTIIDYEFAYKSSTWTSY